MNFKADVWFAQRFLACAGLYTDKIDGSYGKNTATAEAAFNKLVVKYAEQYGRFDDRTEGNIMSLLPSVQVLARKAMIAAKGLGGGLTVQILSGTRTYAEQTAIYEQGRSKPGPIVTKAKAGYSNHNFGIAFDVGVFKGKNYYDGDTPAEIKAYADLSRIIKPVGLEWGGDWKSITDTPHYQAPTVPAGRSTSSIRDAFMAGKAFI